MSFQPSVERYSAIAQFWLLAGGQKYAVAQVAPEFLILARPGAVPPGPATLIIRIDGREEQRSLQVVGPADGSENRLRIA